MVDTASVRRATALKGWLDELLVVVLVVVALLLGWALRAWVVGETVTFTSDDGSVSLRYPARWLSQVDKETVLTVSDVRQEGAFKPRFSLSVREMNPDFPVTQNDLLVTLSVAKAEELTAYRVLSVDSATVGGQAASTMTYAYVAEPPGAAQNGLPVVVQAVDCVVTREGEAYVFTFATLAERFERDEAIFRSILGSVDFS
jgi:hypothetical protein